MFILNINNMAVNDYLRECKYNLNNLDNYIYLYEFDEPILNYITDDEESNGSSINLNGSSYRLYCENVQYSSTSSVDNRFSFDNTLTVTLAESKEVTHYKIIQTLLTNNWMVVFKNTDGDAFVVNAEFPVMVSYNYVFNDEKTPNNLTITFRALQNVPTINYRGSVTFSSTLRDKPCEYSISRIQSLKMIDMNKADIDVEGDGFKVTEKGEGQLKTIEFNPTSLSFTDSYDGREFSQQLSFQIPFDSYRFYFHYNLLEYLDNRYYALIKTTNNNNILGGFRQGLFPSYTVSTSDSGNLITINLNAKYTTYSVLGSDTMSITTNDGFSYTPVLGECVNNIYTWTLIEQINANGVPTNGYYCLNGFKDFYSDYTILGTYEQFDTTFGFKLTDFNIDCSEGCKLYNLPSSIQFKTSGETQCFDLDVTCSVMWEWDNRGVSVDWDEVNKKLCVTSLLDEGTFSIKGTLSDGTIQYATVVIGSGGITGDVSDTIRINASAQTVTIIPSKGFSNVKTVASELQYITNQTGNGYSISVPENESEYSRYFTVNITYNDGTIETIEIIQDKMYYRLIASEETQCFGNDLCYINKKYKGYTETDINIFVGDEKGNVKEVNSPLCMDYDEKVSACTSCFEGYVYTLYEYKKDNSIITSKYEKTTETCTNNGESIYKVNTDKVICSEGVPFYKEELYGISCKDNTTEILLTPVIERVSNTVAEDSDICDVIEPTVSGETLYRWVDTDETYCLPSGTQINCITSSVTNTYCNGYNLYGDIKFFIEPVCGGEEKYVTSTRNKTLIEYDSVECGGNGSGADGTFGDLIFNMSAYYTNGYIGARYVLNGQRFTGDTTNSIDNGDGTYTHYASLEELGVGSLVSMKFWGDNNFFNDPSITQFIKLPNTNNVTDMSSMFRGCWGLKTFDATLLDTTNSINMSYMFAFCQSLTSLNLSSFDTSNVTNMSYMFFMGTVGGPNNVDYQTKLTTLDISSFDTSNVTNMEGMFKGLHYVKTLNLNHFNTSACTNMRYMFHYCGFNTINLSNWDVSKVTDMRQMFGNSLLNSIDLSNWDVSNVEYIDYMFNDCYSLTTVNVSGWDITKILGNNINGNSTLFHNCISLTKVILGNITQAELNFWYGTVENKDVLEYTLID